MSWKHISMRLQTDFQSRSAPVCRGASLFPARRAHLLTTHYMGGGMAFGHRALSEGTFDTWDQEEVDDFGNLCIIQRSVNSRFSNMAPAAKKTTFGQMITKGSLKLRLMAERTSGGSDANIRWKQVYEDFGTEMIEKLSAACRIE